MVLELSLLEEKSSREEEIVEEEESSREEEIVEEVVVEVEVVAGEPRPACLT